MIEKILAVLGLISAGFMYGDTGNAGLVAACFFVFVSILVFYLGQEDNKKLKSEVFKEWK